jgi:hypothetical protein
VTDPEPEVFVGADVQRLPLAAVLGPLVHDGVKRELDFFSFSSKSTSIDEFA